MSPTLIARVDGLPAVLLDREQVWPTSAPASGRGRAIKALSARQRARVARRSAVVHEALTPKWARMMAAVEAEELRLEIRGELAEAGAALMRPSHSPFGWAAVLLIVVAYAHVILEIAVALLAIAVTARVIMSPAPGVIAGQVTRRLWRYRAGQQIAARRVGAGAPDGRRSGQRARGGSAMIARILGLLAAAIGREPGYVDRPFCGPFVTVYGPAPKRPRPYDWPTDDDAREVA